MTKATKLVNTAVTRKLIKNTWPGSDRKMQILTFQMSLTYLDFSLEEALSTSGEMFCPVQLKQCETET